MLVAGVDSSTESTKVILCRAEDGVIVGQRRAPLPGGTRCDPDAWRDALRQAGAGLLERAALGWARTGPMLPPASTDDLVNTGASQSA